EFLRNQVFDAHNFFDPAGAAKTPYKRSQYGGNLGGKIPRDKTFFFVNFEGLKLRATNTAAVTVPTVKMHNGDLSELGTPIRDPLTGQNFQGNVIPADGLDTLGKILTPWYPLPDSDDVL